MGRRHGPRPETTKTGRRRCRGLANNARTETATFGRKRRESGPFTRIAGITTIAGRRLFVMGSLAVLENGQASRRPFALEVAQMATGRRPSCNGQMASAVSEEMEQAAGLPIAGETAVIKTTTGPTATVMAISIGATERIVL